MHIKRMHEMIEKLTECTKMAIEDDQTSVGAYSISDVMDMIKDLSEAEYYSRISKAMEEADEEDKEEIKHIMKKMKEDGEDWDEDEVRRFYRGQARSKTSGRFMSRGDGRRTYMMTPEMYREYPAEYYRDMDRNSRNVMYYTSGGNTGGQSGNSSMGGSTRGYEDGFSDGSRKGYQEGYTNASRNAQRDSREGMSGQSRRAYMEAKELHKDNTPESKQAKMRELENYMKSISEDLTGAIEGASSEEKTMLRTRLQTLAQKIQ